MHNAIINNQLTVKQGCPFASSSTAVLMRGQHGGGLGLLQDTQLIETLAHFSRERIPERYGSIGSLLRSLFRLTNLML